MHCDATDVPRARGTAVVASKQRGDHSVLDRMYQSGAMKVLYPRGDTLQAVLLNTSGGLTGGDRFDITAGAGKGSYLTMTTQAAERVYKSTTGAARVETSATVEADAMLHWLPQETILFDGCNLSRRLTIDLHQSARLLMVEPLVFGRRASGETLKHAHLADEVTIRREGRMLYADRIKLSGDLTAALARAAMGNGAGAAASLVYVASDATAHLEPLRAALPNTGGVSLLHDDTLVLRLLAEDSFALRQTLIPILDRLSGNKLPRCWRL